MSSVVVAIQRFAREAPEGALLWPRWAARQAGVSTADARDEMLKLAGAGVLDLWYVVLCDSGDIAIERKHPETVSIGESAECHRCDPSARFFVEESDIFVAFRVTKLLLTLASENSDQPTASGESGRPKREGVAAPLSHAPTPSNAEKDELASAAPGWNGTQIVFERGSIPPGTPLMFGSEGQLIGKLDAQGSVIAVRGGVKSRDAIKVTNGPRVPEAAQGSASDPSSVGGSAARVQSGIVTAVGMTLVTVVMIAALVLAIVAVVDWLVILPSAFGACAIIYGATNVIAAHLRTG